MYGKCTSICTELDDFIIERIENGVKWVVTLNDGTTVYQDDGRPGLDEHSAWVRLKNFLAENQSLYITKMYIQFRSHVVNLPSDMEGYYFALGACAILTICSHSSFRQYVVGWVKDGVLTKQIYRVPELIMETHKEIDCKEILGTQSKNSLILNSGNLHGR